MSRSYVPYEHVYDDRVYHQPENKNAQFDTGWRDTSRDHRDAKALTPYTRARSELGRGEHQIERRQRREGEYRSKDARRGRDESDDRRNRGRESRRRSPSHEKKHGYEHYRHHSVQEQRARSTSESSSFRQAAKAAAAAGLIEAFRARNNPERATRAATAAAGAAAIGLLIHKEDDSKSKRHVIESTIGGLAFDRVANGSSKR